MMMLGLSICITMPALAAHQASKSQWPRATTNMQNQVIAQALGWVHIAKPGCALCYGYFKEPKHIQQNPKPLPVKLQQTHIQSSGQTSFSSTGPIVFQKRVRISQKGRLLTADKVLIYPDRKTNTIKKIVLLGKVHLREHGKLFVSDKIVIYPRQKIYQIGKSIYHLSPETVPNLKKRFHYRYESWGTADKIAHTANDVLTLTNATYSTCSPLSPTWMIKAGKIILDRPTGKGVAHKVVFFIKRHPVVMIPWFSFPISHKRKTGFLFPTPGYSHDNGAQLQAPFYWNMAPNYDLLITPNAMTRRGIQLNLLFRLLTRWGKSHLNLSFIPHDRGFDRFKNDTLNSVNPQIPTIFYSKLRDMNDDRGYVGYNGEAQFNQQWSTSLTINYVTDPYYFKDYGTFHNEIMANQLLNQFVVRYSGIHWVVNSMLQAYQTLHRIDQIDTGITNQYTRLPEFDISGTYPQFFRHLDFGVQMQFVKFLYHSAFTPQTFLKPLGERFHIRPRISRPFIRSYGFFTPAIALDSTSYFAEQAVTSASQPRLHFNASRNLPIVSIDSGLIFDRNVHWHHHNYTQTLEPRLFYLYVPYDNQNNYPVFDTQLLPFGISQLYSDNLFAGYDRLENANQTTIGLASHLYDQQTGQQLFAGQLGIIYYFQQPKVGLPNSTLPTGSISPLVGQLTYYPAQYWSTSADMAWSITQKNINNAGVSISYNDQGKYLATLGYQFVKNLGSAPTDNLGLSSNTHYIQLGLAWPINEQWSGMGYWYYNVARHRPESYFAGLQYSTCCWAVRFLVNRAFRAISTNSTPGNIDNQYDTTYSVQFLLKGLGSFGSGSSSFLSNDLPGYYDQFK